MEEIEKAYLMQEITSLEECITHLTKAKRALNDVDETDNFYSKIHYLAEEINDFKLQKEAEL